MEIMELNKHEFMKAYASSMAKMVEANPVNILIVDELTTLGAILTAELYEKEETNDRDKNNWQHSRGGSKGS